MTLWPSTLLWRSVLLIAGLLAIAHLAWLQIFRASEIEPRALQAAQQVVSVVNLTRAALVTADPTIVRDAHANGREVVVWSVDTAATVRPLLDARVDGIITSRPDIVRALLEGL